jgi:hypothetical protein
LIQFYVTSLKFIIYDGISKITAGVIITK